MDLFTNVLTQIKRRFMRSAIKSVMVFPSKIKGVLEVLVFLREPAVQKDGKSMLATTKGAIATGVRVGDEDVYVNVKAFTRGRHSASETKRTQVIKGDPVAVCLPATSKG